MARKRLSSAIVSDFLRRIGAGEMEPGERMPPELVLCETYGVGRSVVRDALQALDAKGFIIVRQGSVAVVAPRYRWHVLDAEFLEVNNAEDYFLLLQEARETFEPQLAALAAERASEESVDEMVALNERLATVKDSPHVHAEVDIAFHDALARATDNAVLVSMHNSITGLGQRTRSASAAIPGAIDRAVMWHSQIIDAIRRRDATGAAAAMHLHLRQVRDELASLERVSSAEGEA